MFIIIVIGLIFLAVSILYFFNEGFWSIHAWVYFLLFYGVCVLHQRISDGQKKIAKKEERKLKYQETKIIKKEQKEARKLKKKIEKEEKESQKFLNSSEGKRETAYKELLDISQVSDKLARTILDQYPSLNKINAATLSELSDVPGVGQGLAKAIKIRVSKILTKLEKIKKENAPKKISLFKKKKI